MIRDVAEWTAAVLMVYLAFLVIGLTLKACSSEEQR